MSAVAKGLHLHFDPASGIAGDMTIGALVDAGVPRAVITKAVAAMGVPGLTVHFDRRQRGAYVGTGFDVSWPGHPRKRPSAGGASNGVPATPAGAAAHGHDHGQDHDGHDHDGHDHDGAAHDQDHDHDQDRPDPDRAPGRGRRPGAQSARSGASARTAGQGAGRPRAPASAKRSATPSRRSVASGDAHHRDYAEIRRLLKRAALPAETKDLASEIFAVIADAEARLHGVPLERIAFHEVGAYDSIADIVGAAAAIAWLEPVSISSAPPVLGTGQVRTAHGIVPIPAPATAEILKDVPVRAEGRGELTTPTGAAILATVVDQFGSPPPLRLAAQGFGAGTKELADRPNVLRVLLGAPLGQSLAEPSVEAVLLESNIDDMNPQLVEPLLDALFAAGALDAWSAAILMKKGRPALTVSALAAPATVDAVAQAFFQNSTTIGLRTLPLGRAVLARSLAEVKTAYGRVPVKVSALDGRVMAATPEFEDCRRLARIAGVPVRLVLAAAAAAATLQFAPGGEAKR